MNKKILALALAIVFIATAFTACKNTPELTEINGKEYPLATDAEGNTIVNDKNQIALLVTDENEEVITFEGGEEQTHWLQINGPIVMDDIVRSENSILGIPEGWEVEEITGRVVKKDTNDNAYIQFALIGTTKSVGTHEEYIAKIDSQNKQIVESIEKEGFKAELEKSATSISPDNIQSVYRKYVVKDSSGKIVHYAENYSFEANGKIWSLNYICEEGEGYDETFNFAEYAIKHFEYVTAEEETSSTAKAE